MREWADAVADGPKRGDEQGRRDSGEERELESWFWCLPCLRAGCVPGRWRKRGGRQGYGRKRLDHQRTRPLLHMGWLDVAGASDRGLGVGSGSPDDRSGLVRGALGQASGCSWQNCVSWRQAAASAC